jgi:hypothetical protein
LAVATCRHGSPGSTVTVGLGLVGGRIDAQAERPKATAVIASPCPALFKIAAMSLPPE